jgi:hypothetical protein
MTANRVPGLGGWLRRNSRRAIGLVLAPGLVILAFDAGVGHFAEKAGSNPLQYVPVFYGVIGGVLLLVTCVFKFSRRLFAISMRVIGGVSVLVGAVGTVYHVIGLVGDIQDKGFDAEGLEKALNEAPPTFAPMAFVGLGVILWMLASRNVLIRFRLPKRPKASVL